MIGRLTGRLIEKNPPNITLDVSGIGYDVDVTMSTFYQLPALNEVTTLYTHFVVREDAQLLYGFSSKEERTTFRTIIKISGVGPKIALGILSAMSVNEFVLAIESDDLKRLSSIPGIGKKTAERLVLELRGKLNGSSLPFDQDTTPKTKTASNQDDILNTLLALGYTEKEASSTCKLVPADLSVSEGVRYALKQLMK